MQQERTQGEWRIGDAGFTVFGPPNGTPSPETVATCTKKGNAKFIQQAPATFEALEKLVYMAELVRIDIDESMSGWYHQFKQRLHEAQMQIRKVREG